jgi:hypothetical protein
MSIGNILDAMEGEGDGLTLEKGIGGVRGEIFLESFDYFSPE